MLKITPLLVCVTACLSSFANTETALHTTERSDHRRTMESLEASLVADPGNTELMLSMGRSLLAVNRPDEAVAYFASAVERAPDSADAHYLLGTTHGTLAANASVFKAGGHAKKALGHFEQALALDPRHIEAHNGLIAYYSNAPRVFGGDRDKAEELASALVRLDEYDGKLALAKLYATSDRSDRSAALLDELARDFPNDPRSHLVLGFQAQDRKDYARAHDAFVAGSNALVTDEATRQASLMSLYQIGRTANFSRQHLDAGVAALRKYLSSGPARGTPEQAFAMYRLARLYEFKHDLHSAGTYYAHARSNTSNKALLRQIRHHAID